MHLLELFGLPYVQAPGEAEAQCAELEQRGLVQGTITEDSDVLLFGSRHAYRGFFSARERVEHYSMAAVQERLGLSREKLILLALLLGSDYTLGVRGVGLVNAMEVIAAFEGIQGLARFKAWA
jgi:DNA excision repair protein ERCC-5